MKKIVFITGSARGIGKAIALRLAREEYKIVLHARERSKELEQTEKELIKLKGWEMTVCFDVSDGEQARVGIDEVLKKTKRIDILVNNAGTMADATMEKMTMEQWDRVIKTNLYGPFFMMKNILPIMKKQGWGRVINMTSIAAGGARGKANYAAAKAGLVSLTKSVAVEVAGDGITVNAIAPGYIGEGMSEGIPEKYRKKIIARIAIGRAGSGEDVASLASYLASDESEYITGAVMEINGGWQ